MTFSLRLSNEDSMLIKKYASVHNLTVSELVRQSVMERIENEYDLDAFRKAMGEYRENPQTYSLEEMERELGL